MTLVLLLTGMGWVTPREGPWGALAEPVFPSGLVAVDLRTVYFVCPWSPRVQERACVGALEGSVGRGPILTSDC